MEQVRIIIRGQDAQYIIQGQDAQYTAVLVDEEHNANMVIGYGRSPHEALDHLMRDITENQWIEKQNATQEISEQESVQTECTGDGPERASG